MTTTPDHHPDEATLDFLRSAFAVEWREPALGGDGVAVWEAENRVTLPEPFRTFIAEISNGSSLGPPEDGGLQPLGWLPESWPGTGPRHPGEPFPLDEAWVWEDDETVDAHDPRIDAVFNHGSVVLGAEDGPSFWLLVTAGPHRGEVWMVSDVGAVPTPDTDARSFDGWARHWHSGGDLLAFVRRGGTLTAAQFDSGQKVSRLPKC